MLFITYNNIKQLDLDIMLETVIHPLFHDIEYTGPESVILQSL